MEKADDPFYVQKAVLFSDVGSAEVMAHQDESQMHKFLILS